MCGGLREGKTCMDLQPTTVQASSVEHLPHTIRTQPERMFQAAMAVCAKALRQGQAWHIFKAVQEVQPGWNENVQEEMAVDEVF